MFSTKAGAAKLLICVVIGLIIIKLLVSWLTGSISVLAQTADSFFDLLAGIITFSAIRIAAKPPDKEHPYGHGKVEDIAGIVQGTLIFIAGVMIIYSSVRRIMEGSTVELAETGMAVMLVSIIVSIFLSRHLLKVAHATGSIALEANAKNIATDVYSAIAVLVGLVIVRFTNIVIIDSVIAEVSAKSIWNKPIITQVEPLHKFYKAEEYHGAYFDRHQKQPYCQLVIVPKLDKLRTKFRDKVKSKLVTSREFAI